MDQLSSGAPTAPDYVFLTTGDAAAALAERTAHVDRKVIDAANRLLFPSDGSPAVALLAVGGYGRRHLFPYSDIDLLLLFPSTRDAQAHKEPISLFLRELWDSGMRISQSVRTPGECVEVHDQNVELNISLLDQRYLAGDRALYAELARRLPRFIHGSRDALIRNLSRLTRERHSKYADTFYHLEPNVKETPGGLRDYQLLCWLEQLRETGPTHVGAADPAAELWDAFRHLSRIRCFLHCQAGRDHNLLSFDAQDAMAEQSAEPDPAVWMRDYYRHARAIYRAAMRALESNEAESSSLFAQFRDWRSRVSNADFSVHRDRVHFRAPQRLDHEPGEVLTLFEFVARHGIRPSFEAERQVAARLPKIRKHFRTPQPAWPALREILSLPYAPLAVRTMHETGVDLAIFPELESIECLVVRDFYHRYTVDEHTLVAMQTVWGLRLAQEPGRRQYGDLMAEIKDPAVLLFALWFHDVGKGSTGEGEGHVDASLRIVEGPMARIQMPQAARDMVRFLIDKHLELSAAMQSRDVSDPHAIQELAHRAETVERLKNLTVLTYADISAVNPQVMTAWRAEQLWQLYLAIYNELTRELEAERIEVLPSGPPERVEFLQGFPTRYLRTHNESEIVEHMALEERSRARGGVAVDIRRLDSAWHMTLVAGDRAGLFAASAGVLAGFGMNILKAEAFANRRGIVLDTFTFADPNRTLDLNPTEVDRLRSVAEKVISGKTDVRQLLKNRRKPQLPSRKARIPARVSFDSHSGSATLIEIVAEDRPGLLYDLASAISNHGGNIEVVLIDTQAHKAIDVFYVTEEGRKLSPEKQQVLAENLRQACEAG